MSATLWRITCMEDQFPGLWQQWIRCQCVTVGYPPERGYRILNGKTKGEYDWVRARNALQKIMPGHFIVAALPGRRIGRLGEVIRNESAKDRWQPLLPASPDLRGGHMGRRILVRWDLENSPNDLDLVAKLPLDFPSLGRGTLNCIRHISVEKFQEVMANQKNWVGLLGRFGYEWALSDYIAMYPHKLKNGLKPYPNEKKIREKVFKDRSRADVLLCDVNDNPIIVECKRESPDVEAIRQLQGYIKRLKGETGTQASGILVHGGARTVDKKVWYEANKSSRIEIFQYKLDVEFTRSC
jgi:hypothetical protein